MERILIHRNRPITREDINFIRKLIQTHPDTHRTALSKKICQAWRWVQPNGHPKDMICRGLLLRLGVEGFIELADRQRNPNSRPWYRKEPEHVNVDQSPIETNLGTLGPLVIHQVRCTPSGRSI